MRILILGKNRSSLSFYKFFEKNPKNIVFSDIEGKNCIEFNDIQDIIDFCEANDINLVLINDENYIDIGLGELLSQKNISAFSPSIEAISICSSKAVAKKFMHKNKIQTPKFAIVEKAQIALDYIQSSHLPQAIKPDTDTYQEGVQFCETYSQAQKIIENLFSTGNKKILIEDYIEGKNFSVFALSDGYRAQILGICAKYQNDIALFNPSFVSEELKEKIEKEVILKTIEAQAQKDEEYIGILGFDFILTYDNNLYLLSYESFFDDLCVDFFTRGFNVDWAKIFDSCIVGDVFLKHKIVTNGNYMLTIRQNEKIHFISARTKSGIEKYLEELGLDINLYNEAQKIWKY